MWKIFCEGHILSTAGDALSVFNIIIYIIYTHIHTYKLQQGETESIYAMDKFGRTMVSEKVGF
jgi:hypothetical protein